MDSMTMAMTMTGTPTATASPSSTSMSGMGGMHMGGDNCKISMLWNWNTIDACFITKSWHITSQGMFAGSCIGVICLVMTLEFLRRLSREYDLFIIRQTAESSNGTAGSSGLGLALTSRSRSEGIDVDADAENIPAKSTPPNCNPPAEVAAGGGGGRARELSITFIHHLIRTLLHTAQFVVAYIVMLLAMYYNGYVIICIFVGAFLGALVFGWDGVRVGGGLRFGNDATAVTKCCG